MLSYFTPTTLLSPAPHTTPINPHHTYTNIPIHSTPRNQINQINHQKPHSNLPASPNLQTHKHNNTSPFSFFHNIHHHNPSIKLHIQIPNNHKLTSRKETEIPNLKTTTPPSRAAPIRPLIPVTPPHHIRTHPKSKTPNNYYTPKHNSSKQHNTPTQNTYLHHTQNTSIPSHIHHTHPKIQTSVSYNHITK
ncbi:hypothetical protein KMI_19g19980 [Encephalitozoon hellem]|nr:hypothetical protein KMI_19g19980 [Encephalitozoon hellem]